MRLQLPSFGKYYYNRCNLTNIIFENQITNKTNQTNSKIKQIQNLIKQVAKIIATGLGSGLAPVAPGTFGTAFGLLCYVGIAYGMNAMDGAPNQTFYILLIGLSVLFTLIGTWSISVLDDEWGHDPGKIVIDEVVGVWITLFFVPFSWFNVLLAFVIFRFFDILKPLGIKTIDKKMHTSFSVMLDDILAGVYSALTLQLIINLI